LLTCTHLLGYAHRKAEEIMPCDYSKYPTDWKTVIRPAILKRSGDCCENCGVRNHKMIRRSKINGANYIYIEDNDNQTCRGFDIGLYNKPIRVVLTIAHLDHDTNNNDHANLAALCQRCHLRYDAELHAETRRKNKK
jgi:hypothetical protein